MSHALLLICSVRVSSRRANLLMTTALGAKLKKYHAIQDKRILSSFSSTYLGPTDKSSKPFVSPNRYAVLSAIDEESGESAFSPASHETAARES